jgi:hypothetical protein
MTWASGGSLGQANNKTSGTNNLVLTVSAAAAVGEYVVVMVSGDNITAADGDNAEHSIADSAGNTWVKHIENTNGNAAGAGITLSIWGAQVTTAMVATTTTITLTTSATITAKALTAWKFTKAAGATFRVYRRSQEADAADPPAMTNLAGTLKSGVSYLTIHGLAVEGISTDTFTQDGDLATVTESFTSGGTAATNAGIRGGYAIQTGTTPSIDVGNTARDHSQAVVVLAEDAPSDFPELVASATSVTSTNATSHTVSLPSGIAAGDLLVVIAAFDGVPTVTWPAGWTNQSSGSHTSSTIRHEVRARVADGTEGASISLTTGVGEQGAFWAGRFKNHAAGGWTTNGMASDFASGSDAQPNPPSASPSGGTLNYAWMGNAIGNGAQAFGAGYESASYTALAETESTTDDANAVTLQTAWRKLAASLENPGLMDIAASADWIGLTLAVYPGYRNPFVAAPGNTNQLMMTGIGA